MKYYNIEKYKYINNLKNYMIFIIVQIKRRKLRYLEKGLKNY